ncbi:MAG: dihydrofolate reductase family protein [Acidobacteria bacterium]|nr:dihydrofolate reductase family protein [Acidobacteriota bacterium]
MRGDWLARFGERKTREAIAAELPAYRTEFDCAAPPLVPIGSRWTRERFDGAFYVRDPPKADLPAASLVFVQSRDGNTVAADPAALGGGATDRHLIYEGLSRVAADGVLAGAGTISGGRVAFSVWHPEIVALRAALGLPRHPLQIVATLRGVDLERGPMFNVPSLPVVIITLGSGAEAMRRALERRPWIEAVRMEQPEDLAGAFRRLRALGIRRLSAVGGRGVARALIDAGLIQDLYLTTSAASGGVPDTPLYPAALPAAALVRKCGTGAERGVVFEHYHLCAPRVLEIPGATG